ncbi:uncharacterized protein V2V93DRAFT_373996 [Kockiozyma suomiensis]|uniref:uncharacterized protein n=1 Tax=Kockiozyma suomiensis TaxID=1337062 RepID=UPI0033432053
MRFTSILFFALAFVLIAAADFAFAEKKADTLRISITERVPKDKCLRKTRKGDQISVEYVASLPDGTVFDSSVSRDVPFRFVLGEGRVISGWDQGLLGMCVGESRKLTVPPHLAYGDREIARIPPGSTLIFETKLLGISGYTPWTEETKQREAEILAKRKAVEEATADEQGEPETEQETEKATIVDAEPTLEGLKTGSEAAPIEEIAEPKETLVKSHDEL